MNEDRLKVLLIEDDEDDYVLIRDMLGYDRSSGYALDWAATYEQGVEALACRQHDICLLDYRLGDRDGLELLQEAKSVGFEAPIVILTGQGHYEVDSEAMKNGAADYLEKEVVNRALLERTIRYAISRKRVEDELRVSQERLKILASRLIDVQEKERRRAAQELHDSIGASLAAVKFGLESKIQSMSGHDTPPGVSLEDLVALVRKTISETRRVSMALRPSILDDLGLLDTINWLCLDFEKIYSNIRIIQEIDISENEIPDALKIVIFRILQEALHNVAKHSRADLVRVSLKKEGSLLNLWVEDSGQGFDPESIIGEGRSDSMGIESMRERTEFSGGRFQINTCPGEGTTVHASWAYQSGSHLAASPFSTA